MKEELTFEAVREVFTNYLQQKKHRKTPERFAILKQIFDNEGHFDAESLYNHMQKDYRVSLATVYNTMELLLDCGLIVKHPFAGQTSQFEKTFGNSIHHHLVCTKCGSVKEFSDKKNTNSHTVEILQWFRKFTLFTLSLRSVQKMPVTD